MSEGYCNDFSYTTNIYKEWANARYGVGNAYTAAVNSFTDYILHGHQEASVPHIYDVKVYNDKVVKVIFADRTTETAVCQDGDTFDLDIGITICFIKKMLGRNEYFRMLKKAKKNAEAHRKIEKLSKEAVEIRKRQRAKKEAKKRARREKRNKELATAIANAMNTKKNAIGSSILVPKKV